MLDACAKVMNILSKKKSIPSVEIIRDFYNEPSYVDAIAKTIDKHWQKGYDYLLTSYHGLPERQSGDYREHCFETSSLIAKTLQLPNDKWGVSFQSF